MNFVFYFIYIIIQLLIVSLGLKVFSLIPINFIFGSINTYLNFSQSFYFAANSVFPISIFILFLKNIFFSFSKFKIATFFSGIFFYCLKKIKDKKFKYFFSFIFLFFYSFLIFLNPKIYWYGFGWLLSIFLIHSRNIFLQSFSTVWFAHGIGTIIFILNNKNYGEEFYRNIVFISWIERIILALSLTLFYLLFFNLNKKIIYFLSYLEKNIKILKKGK